MPACRSPEQRRPAQGACATAGAGTDRAAFTRIAGLALLACGLLAGAAHGQALAVSESTLREGERTTRLETGGLVVTVAQRPGAHLRVALGGDHPCADIAVPTATADALRRAFRRGRLLVLEAALSGHGNYSHFVLLDAAACRFVGQFHAYGAALSPDFRRVAFVRFFPLHGTEGSEDQVHVVDLDAAPVFDPDDEITFAPGARLLTAPGDVRDAPNAEVEPSSAHRLASAIVWGRDGGSLAFVERQGSAAPAVVVVDVSTRPFRVARWPFLSHPEARPARYELHLDGYPNVLAYTVRDSASGPLREAVRLGPPRLINQ